MVSEVGAAGQDAVMSASCADFTQNAWKKDLCINCQRSRAEHGPPDDSGDTTKSTPHGTDSPKPAKRNSLMTKSWTVIQADECKVGEEADNEEDKWNAMCLPDPDQPEQPLGDHDRKAFVRPEHCYEDIDGETMLQGQSSKTSSSSKQSTSDTVCSNKDDAKSVTIKQQSSDAVKSKLSETMSGTTQKEESKAADSLTSKPRSRSSSRDKSPAPIPKKKPEKFQNVQNKDLPASKDGKVDKPEESSKGNVSPRSRKKLKKGQRSISFVEDDPLVIGDDGGLDNLYSDNEDDVKETEDEAKEVLKFTEDEKDWAMQVLKNTIWNTEHIGAGEDSKTAQSKEFEDLQVESLLKPDRFANVRECEPFPEHQNFGTFPLRNKSEKSAMDNLFSGNRLSTLSESLENTLLEGAESDHDKYESVLKFLGVDKDLLSSPKRNKNDASKDKLDAADDSEQNYDDPWEDKFAFENNSEMNLLDEIRGEIDLDASGAGLALVDLLNDVLAKYSESPSETDSIKNFDSLEDGKTEKGGKREGKEKNAELEAKMGILAASLRKQRAKGKAPRPPSCPPDPPPDLTRSPAKQLELRAAQSKEPTFKMVPIGKPIGGNPLSQSAPASSSHKETSQENMEGYKLKAEKDKQKKSGGFGSFFSRILRRGKDSDSDIATSTETLVSNTDTHSDADSDKGSTSEKHNGKEHAKAEKRSSKSSPQMKLKVLPTRPISPKPPDKPPQAISPKPPDKPPQSKDTNKDVEKDLKSSQKTAPPARNSPLAKNKSKDNLNAETTDKPSSPENKGSAAKEEPSKNQLSPTKSTNKEQLAASPKSKEAPPLPLNPPREIESGLAPPKPRARGNSDGGPTRSRPRTRDTIDGKPRDIPNVPPPKPPVAAKPKPAATHTKSLDITDNTTKVSPPRKERLSSSTSLDEEATKVSKPATDGPRNADPKMLRKRAKSPKRCAAPLAPGRASMPNILTDSNTSLTSNVSEASIQSMPSTQSSASKSDSKGLAFAKELELKLHKDQTHTNVTEARKMSAPPLPPSPGIKLDTNEKSKSLPKESTKPLTKDKDIPKSTKETEKVKSASKDDLKTSPPIDEKQKPVASESETHPVAGADIPFLPEKIELPRPAGNSRKSFLGKLNRKSRPPPPPAVKRTKSITESSMAGDLHLKKIDLKDISGPVEFIDEKRTVRHLIRGQGTCYLSWSYTDRTIKLITDMCSNKVVSRRNTISLGDDNTFHSGGSTSSGSTSAGDKSELSPRGSIENLYEFITSEAPTPPTSDKKNLYDPVVEKTIGLRPPSICGSEGYLEPVRSNNGPTLGEPVKSNMADSANSLGSSMTTSLTSGPSMNKSTCEDLDIPPAIDDTEHLEISDERRLLLASQPIYEEINGYGKLDSGKNGGKDDNQLTMEPVEENIYGVNMDVTHNASAAQEISSHNHPSLPTLKSKDSFSSESDLSSANNSLSRPRPIPRKRPRPVGSGFEQYVAMNRPSVAVFLNEEQLREMLSKLTAMNLQTLREIYAQHEKCFTKENLQLGEVGPLKWHDFNIYGNPLHRSEKCIVYNAKLKTSVSPCQVMLLHSRPEITSANHPSLLKPTCIFTDSIPFSYLTEDFIRTSQILETCVNQSSQVKCYIVVGLFDITESLTNHLNSLQTACETQRDFLRKILFYVLQLLSAISHCLEQGHPLAETDFHDLYLISNPYCLGETVSFLPQVRAPEDQQIETVCLFLEKFLHDMCAHCEASSVLDDSAFFMHSGIQKVIGMLQSGVAECLPIVRSYSEFLLWGPQDGDSELGEDRQSNLEPRLSMWLERQRANLIHDFAMRVQHVAHCNIMDFYKMKFLLKASSGSLAECLRCHMSTS